MYWKPKYCDPKGCLESYCFRFTYLIYINYNRSFFGSGVSAVTHYQFISPKLS